MTLELTTQPWLMDKCRRLDKQECSMQSCQQSSNRQTDYRIRSDTDLYVVF